MPDDISSKEDFFNAIKRLKIFCKEAGVKPDSLASVVELYNQVLSYSQEHSIPFNIEPEPSWKFYRTALLADIHGNWDALSAALHDIEGQQCDRVVCLGDIVDGGDDDEKVLKHLIESNITLIRGNHDDYPPIRMDNKLQECLKSLPGDIIEDDIIFTHISPREKELPVKNPIEAWNVFDETSWRIIFVGHLHYPIIFGKNDGSSCNAKLHDFEYSTPFHLQEDDRYIICPGPVGYSRDDIDQVRYGIFDSNLNTIEIRMVDGPMLEINPPDWWK